MKPYLSKMLNVPVQHCQNQISLRSQSNSSVDSRYNLSRRSPIEPLRISKTTNSQNTQSLHDFQKPSQLKDLVISVPPIADNQARHQRRIIAHNALQERENALNELVSTEDKYVALLHTIITNVRLDEAKATEKQITMFESLMACFCELLKEHLRLLNGFSNSDSYASVICQHISFLKKPYYLYFMQLELFRALPLYVKENVDEKSAQILSRASLDTQLLEPFQRLTRYRLILERILQNERKVEYLFPEEHMAISRQAVIKVDEILRYFQTIDEKTKDACRLRNIEISYPFKHPPFNINFVYTEPKALAESTIRRIRFEGSIKVLNQSYKADNIEEYQRKGYILQNFPDKCILCADGLLIFGHSSKKSIISGKSSSNRLCKVEIKTPAEQLLDVTSKSEPNSLIVTSRFATTAALAQKWQLDKNTLTIIREIEVTSQLPDESVWKSARSRGFSL